MTTCPVCASHGIEDLLTLSGLPTRVHFACSTPEEARKVPRADIELAWCTGCGHSFNRTFDAGAVDYTGPYDNALHFSPRFRGYLDELVRELVEEHGVHDTRVMEVGCGDGAFLGKLCQLGGNLGIGYEPSAASAVREDTFRIVPASFNPGADRVDAGLICCRQVLEHVENPVAFLQDLKPSHGQATLLVEVPNAGYMLREIRPWDILYEHPGYFTARSLQTVLARAGWRVTSCRGAFEGQYLLAFASTQDASHEAGVEAPDPALYHAFTGNTRALLEDWRSRAATWNNVVMWGAGTKTITFLNLVKAGERVAAVVDINPRKQGHFVPGTGHPIVGPGALIDLQPARVVVMNPAYRQEVREQLAAEGVQTELLVLPSS